TFEMQVWLSLLDAEPTRRLSQRVLAVSTEQCFPFFVASATCAYGWTRIQEGALQAGAAQIRQGLAIFEASGATLPRSYWLGFVAEALLAEHERAEGLATVEEALTISEQHLTRTNDAELHRLRGELLLIEPT